MYGSYRNYTTILMCKTLKPTKQQKWTEFLHLVTKDWIVEQKVGET